MSALITLLAGVAAGLVELVAVPVALFLLLRGGPYVNVRNAIITALASGAVESQTPIGTTPSRTNASAVRDSRRDSLDRNSRVRTAGDGRLLMDSRIDSDKPGEEVVDVGSGFGGFMLAII